MNEEHDPVDIDSDDDFADDDVNDEISDEDGAFVHLRLRISKTKYPEYQKFRDERGLSNQQAFDFFWDYYSDSGDLTTQFRKKEAIKQKAEMEYEEAKSKIENLSSIKNKLIEYVKSKPFRNGVGYIGMTSEQLTEIREESDKFIDRLNSSRLELFNHKDELIRKMNMVNISVVWKSVITKFYDDVLPND